MERGAGVRSRAKRSVMIGGRYESKRWELRERERATRAEHSEVWHSPGEHPVMRAKHHDEDVSTEMSY